MRRGRFPAQRAQLGRCRVQLRDDAIVALIAAQLDARAVHLLDRAALGGERVHGHERRAHRGLCETEVVRARDLECLSKRVERLRGVAAPGAHVDESCLGPAERGHVRALLLKSERAKIGALRDVELAEEVMQLRESESLRELAGPVRKQGEHRLGLEVRPRRVLELAEVGVTATDEMPDPRRLRRRALADQLLRFASLRECLPRTPQIPKRLRRPGERAREALVVTGASQLIGRVAVVRERTLVVPAHAVKKTAEEQHPWEPPLDTGREAIEPALQRRDLAALHHTLAVIANELCCALVLAGLLQVMDRAIAVASSEGAFGVTPMELDDLRGGQELARAGAKELREERLKAVTGACRAVPHDEPGLFERGDDLAGCAAGRHRLVLLETLEERPAKERVLIFAWPATEDFAVEVRVELRATPAELAELAPAALADERGGEAQPRGPATGAPVDRVDGVLGQIQTELAAQQLDRFGTRERELRRRDIQDRTGEAPARQPPELRRAACGEHQMRALGKELDEFATEARERCAALHARVIVHEEDEVPEGRELVGERLRELREPPLEAAPAVERRQELLAELRVIAAQRADEVGEEHERVLVAALQGEPGHLPPRGAEEIGVLRQEGRLAVAGGRVHQREPMALRAPKPLEEPLPLQQRERKRWWGVPRSIGSPARDGQGAKDALRPRA